MFAFLLAKKRLICFKLDDAEDDEDEDEEEKEVLVLGRVLGDAKQTLPDILVVFLFIIVEKVFRRKEKKKTNNDNTRTQTEFLQHVLSLSLVVVVVVFIVPDLHVQRPGAVLREIRVVFMDETKIVTQMENKTRTPAEETERRRTRESRRVLFTRGG